MKYIITTFDDEGNEIVSRNYTWNGNHEDVADNANKIVDDSLDYLEDIARSNAEWEETNAKGNGFKE